MTINTTRFGLIDVDDEALISLPEGPIGFSSYTSFCLIDHQRESVFKWLQCTQDPDVAFLVMDPSDVVADYEVELPDWDVEFLDLKDPSEAVAIATVTIDASSRLVTTNLLAPIVVNARTRVGRQVVLSGDQYSIRHEICPLRGTSKELQRAA